MRRTVSGNRTVTLSNVAGTHFKARVALLNPLPAGSSAKDTSQEPQPSTCMRYSFDELAAATDGWAHVVGSGAFGTVYRGKDPENADVAWAVKRANVVTHDFRKEVRGLLDKNI